MFLKNSNLGCKIGYALMIVDRNLTKINHTWVVYKATPAHLTQSDVKRVRMK